MALVDPNIGANIAPVRIQTPLESISQAAQVKSQIADSQIRPQLLDEQLKASQLNRRQLELRMAQDRAFREAINSSSDQDAVQSPARAAPTGTPAPAQATPDQPFIAGVGGAVAQPPEPPKPTMLAGIGGAMAVPQQPAQQQASAPQNPVGNLPPVSAPAPAAGPQPRLLSLAQYQKIYGVDGASHYKAQSDSLRQAQEVAKLQTETYQKHLQLGSDAARAAHMAGDSPEILVHHIENMMQHGIGSDTGPQVIAAIRKDQQMQQSDPDYVSKVPQIIKSLMGQSEHGADFLHKEDTLREAQDRLAQQKIKDAPAVLRAWRTELNTQGALVKSQAELDNLKQAAKALGVPRMAIDSLPNDVNPESIEKMAKGGMTEAQIMADATRKGNADLRDQHNKTMEGIAQSGLDIRRSLADIKLSGGGGRGGDKPMTTTEKIRIESQKSADLKKAESQFSADLKKAHTDSSRQVALDALKKAKQAAQDAYEDKIRVSVPDLPHKDLEETSTPKTQTSKLKDLPLRSKTGSADPKQAYNPQTEAFVKDAVANGSTRQQALDFLKSKGQVQ